MNVRLYIGADGDNKDIIKNYENDIIKHIIYAGYNCTYNIQHTVYNFNKFDSLVVTIFNILDVNSLIKDLIILTGQESIGIETLNDFKILKK